MLACPAALSYRTMPMSDSASASQGRFIRAALVIFPAGTIVLGIMSFGIWWWKRERVEERGYKYAMALRRDLSEEGLRRHAQVLDAALSRPDMERFQAVAAYMESSMGPENMGYNVRRDRVRAAGAEFSNVEVELTGKPRPREIVLLLAPYGDSARAVEESCALAMLMSLAHAMTGETRARTLRLAAVPAHADSGALQRLALACEERRERVIEVFVAGGAGDETRARVEQAFQSERTGAVVRALPAVNDAAAAFAAAAPLKAALLSAAE